MSDCDDYDDPYTTRGDMRKRACMSECRNPKDRSDKDCACGGHSMRARKKRKPSRKTIRQK